MILQNAEWLREPDLQKLLHLLSQGGEEALLVGGAVRNALLGEPVSDIDIATTVLPDITLQRCQSAGFHAFPLSLHHGTVRIISGSRSYEITTLREDLATNGRHVTAPCFGRNFLADAQRRDFTMNALYADSHGRVRDLVGGLADLEKRLLRFIGDPAQRIAEDYLRILRFFRFFACYGAGRPDEDALHACFRMQEGLDRLSRERILMEIEKILCSRDPFPALLWMKKTGIMKKVLPGTGLGGNERLHALLKEKMEYEDTEKPDFLLRLLALLPCKDFALDELVTFLKMPNFSRKRLTQMLNACPLASLIYDHEIGKVLYYEDRKAVLDCLTLQIALVRWRLDPHLAEDDLDEICQLSQLFLRVQAWSKPFFPISAKDFLAEGKAPGPNLGSMLLFLKRKWVDSNFTLNRQELLSEVSMLCRNQNFKAISRQAANLRE